MNEKVGKTFGGRVRAIRKRLGLTQTDFGRGLVISLPHLSDIELEKKKPCHDFFYHMVKVYRVNINYLLLGEGGMFLGERELPLTERLKTGNPDVDVFLHYFFRNDIVKFNALLAFSKLMDEDGARIKKNLSEPES